MNENLVLRTTVDFIRSSPKNLDLALQIEEAMPRLKADLIEEFLKSLTSTITTDEWRLHRSDAGVCHRNDWLALRRADWPPDEDPTDRTGIWLSAGKLLWGGVYVGVYLSKMTRQRISANEQHALPKMRQASDALPQGKGWQTHEFSHERLGAWDGWANYKYLEEPVRDWGSASFLQNSLDGDRKQEMVESVASRMECLKRGASRLIEATLQRA